MMRQLPIPGHWGAHYIGISWPIVTATQSDSRVCVFWALCRPRGSGSRGFPGVSKLSSNCTRPKLRTRFLPPQFGVPVGAPPFSVIVPRGASRVFQGEPEERPREKGHRDEAAILCRHSHSTPRQMPNVISFQVLSGWSGGGGSLILTFKRGSLFGDHREVNKIFGLPCRAKHRARE